MDLYQHFIAAEQDILDEAFGSLSAARATHYEARGEPFIRDRLSTLFTCVTAAMRDRELCSMIEHANEVAAERFGAGFGIEELQACYNALEIAMWRHLVATVPGPELAEPIGLLSTVLGAGKDALARTYVSLATHRRVPAIDVAALSEGACS